MPPMTSLPSSIVLYTRPGCHLCDETRQVLTALVASRVADGLAAPSVEERNIETNAEWERANFSTIPVVEVGVRRLELAISASKLRAFLIDTLDGVAAPTA
jgi:hypothetical protein